MIKVTVDPTAIVRYEGLAKLNTRDIRLQVHNRDFLDDGVELVRSVASYVEQSGRTITAEQTMSYGYWLIKFVDGGDGSLHIHEYNAEATDFVKGADLTLTLLGRAAHGLSESRRGIRSAKA